MKNNKGFAISSVVYAMLILFLGLILLILGNLASRKAMFDKEKNEILMRFNNYGSSKKFENGEVVYFNVTSGELCSSSEYTETQSNTGVKEGCMKFYAFNDDGKNKVNLILDHNTTQYAAWNSSGSNSSGPKDLLDQLKADTRLWKGTETPSNYTMDQTIQKSNANYKINYSTYKARLITAQEIAKITGYKEWDEKSSTNVYYFDTKTSSPSPTCKSGNTTGCKYGWLYDRTYTSCIDYGCLNNSNVYMIGYWTASSYSNSSSSAWYVNYGGFVVSGGVSTTNYFGVRPVIEVLKSKLVKTYANGEVVYFNVDNGTKCTSSEAVSTTGTKSGCMKFYAFNDNGGDTVNLILDHNTTTTVAWITKEDYINAGGEDLSSDEGACQYGNLCSKNEYGSLTLLTQLKNDTKSWVGTKTPSNYTMDQTGQTSNAKYTIDYSSYKARLITTQEIAKITGNTSWNDGDGTSIFYFDTNTSSQSATCKSGNTTGCSYGWLYDRTGTNCTEYGCLNNSDQATDGYWTSSSLAMDNSGAWYVQFGSNTRSGFVGGDSYSGVRPVIEVLKSNLI